MADDLVVREIQELVLPDTDTLIRELKEVRQFQATVKKLLIEGSDWGVIPGTQKPTLLKPGAEKIDKILHLADTYEIANQVEDWDKGFFHYQFRCRLIIIGTDIVVSEGMGSCNSKESKYRYRWVFESALPMGIDKADLSTKKVKVKGNWVPTYKIEHENPQDLANTILKMAKKRAHIDATLSASRLSDVFTQDIEDITVQRQPDDEPELAPDATKSKSSLPKTQTDSASPPPVEPETVEWIGISLNTLRGKELEAWTEDNILSYMRTSYKVEAETILEALAELKPNQLTHFKNRIQAALDVA